MKNKVFAGILIALFALVILAGVAFIGYRIGMVANRDSMDGPIQWWGYSGRMPFHLSGRMPFMGFFGFPLLGCLGPLVIFLLIGLVFRAIFWRPGRFWGRHWVKGEWSEEVPPHFTEWHRKMHQADEAPVPPTQPQQPKTDS
jgi:hypothetical protein